MKEKKRFQRIPHKNYFGGVCAGIAYYFGIRVWIVRLLLVMFTLLLFYVPAIVYILLWQFAPEAKKEPSDYDKVSG